MGTYLFHSNCGTSIKLSADKRTAKRIQTDFNNGLVFADRTLTTNCIFQVQIQKKTNVWNGGIELGVTTENPDLFTQQTMPQTAAEIKQGSWMMTRQTVLRDGETLLENYGYDLEKLGEGHTVGLMRTDQGSLVFFINGTSQGVAAYSIPKDVYCFVNLYGKCYQVSLIDVPFTDQCTNTLDVPVPIQLVPAPPAELNLNSMTSENNTDQDRLKFHETCGPLVSLSCHNKVAERIRPMEEFNNAVILTHRSLRVNELFQIRIDLLIQKWSGSLEFGVTRNAPETFDLPATLTIVKNTVIMSGNGVLHNGKATGSPYSHFNLDQLQEGDRIGVMLQTGEEVHYFVNGIDQGCAATGILPPVWGCVNLYGMAAKVTIVDRNEREEHNLRVSTRSHEYLVGSSGGASNGSVVLEDDCLLFHPNCGFHASVINAGRTAYRPNARDDFNHGVVLTNRNLKANELFEVRLDKLVSKWAGSIEIGVTTHSPNQLEYPCTMTNVRTGTWILTGNGIMHNGVSIIDDFGQSLDRLKVGDTVGVMRTELGNLHFFVNGEDQGCAATNVPSSVFGVIDLYGQAAEASIVTNNRSNHLNVSSQGIIDTSLSSVITEGEMYPMDQSINRNKEDTNSLNVDDELRFHSLCGKNARIYNSNMSVSRPNALGEFNAAIAISNRPLRDGELFEVVIERMVDRWSGNLELGVTSIKPEELEFPNTMTDVDHDTWILSGSNFMIAGSTITHHYNCNLDSLTCGSRVGVMRKADSSLHFFINGVDKGGAAYNIPTLVWAVVDLYGQCQQVSISNVKSESCSQVIESLNLPSSAAAPAEIGHRFSNCCGKNIVLKCNNLEATRVHHFTNALVFSSVPLEIDEIFEIRITEINAKWAGTLVFGITTLPVSSDDYTTASFIPITISAICSDTWFIVGNQVRKNNIVINENYCYNNLNEFYKEDRIGIRISSENALHCYINGKDVGKAVHNLPKVPMFAVFDLYGQTGAIKICSSPKSFISPSKDRVESVNVSKENQITKCLGFDTRFCGKNIEISENNCIATRNTSSYNHGLVFLNQFLVINHLLEVKLSKINRKWSSSIMVGVFSSSLEKLRIPSSARMLQHGNCFVAGQSVYRNGYKLKHSFGNNLDLLQEGQTIGLLIDSKNCLHIFINGNDQGIIFEDLENDCCRAMFDLYGACEEITLLGNEELILTTNSMTQLNINCNIINNSNDQSGVNNGRNVIINSNCEYLKACIDFKEYLCLPDPYFPSSEPTLCLCNNCSNSDEQDSSNLCQFGEPAAEFTIPFGWVRFPINFYLETSSSPQNIMITSTLSYHNVMKSWHVAYFGTPISHVREILDARELFPFNSEFESFREDIFQEKTCKDENAEGSTLLFSPCTEYAAVSEFCPPYRYTDPMTGKHYLAKALFQIAVQPGAYKVGAPSFPVPIEALQNLKLCSNSIEWSTKEERATLISALLIKLAADNSSHNSNS